MKRKRLKKRIFIISTIYLFIFSIYMLCSPLQKHEVHTNTTSDLISIKEKQSVSTEDSLIIQIKNYLQTKNISQDQLAISIYVPTTDTSYEINASTDMFSASLYKVPLAMLYYEYIEGGSISLEDTLLYTENCYEDGGPIASTYVIGSYICIEELLYDMIVYSDNTAAHILFEHLGGWSTYRTLIENYSEQAYTEIFYNENVFSASYATDVLQYLYQHSSTYSTLIRHMQLVFPNNYLGRNLNVQIAQKYGSYGIYENAMGIVFGDHPYLITIMSSLGNDALEVIGDLNEIIYNYFDKT